MNSSKKMFFLLTFVFIVVIFGIAATLYFGRTYLAKSEEELVATKLDIEKLNQTEQIYRQNIEKLDEYSEIADIIAQIVPSEKDQARAVRDLNVIMDEYNLNIKTITFPSSDLSKKSTGTSTSTKPVNSATSQAKAIKGLEGVLGINVNLELTNKNSGAITTSQIVDMLKRVENNRRNLRVDSISFSAGDESINMQLTLFIKPS